MNGRIDTWVAPQMDGWVDGWMDGWIDGWMSEVQSSLNISWFSLSGIDFVCELTPIVRQNNLRSSASE